MREIVERLRDFAEHLGPVHEYYAEVLTLVEAADVLEAKDAEIARLMKALKRVLSTSRGSSGRIILELHDEERLRGVLGKEPSR